MSHGTESALQAADIARQQARQKKGRQSGRHPNDKRPTSDAVKRHLERMSKLHA